MNSLENKISLYINMLLHCKNAGYSLTWWGSLVQVQYRLPDFTVVAVLVATHPSNAWDM